MLKYVLMVLLVVSVAKADIYFQNETGANVTNFTAIGIPKNSTLLNYNLCTTSSESIVQQFLFTAPGFTGNLSNTTLNNLTGCAPMNVTIFTPNLTSQVSTDHKVVVLTTLNSTELPINLTIVSTLNWDVTPKNVTQIVEKNEIGQGVFLLENFGNIPVTVSVATDNNDENVVWVDTSAPLVIPPANFIVRPFYYNMYSLVPGKREINITFTDQTQFKKELSLNLNLQDIYPPEINNVELFYGDEIKADAPQIIIVNAQDDKGISQILIESEGNVSNFTRVSPTTYQFNWNNLNVSGIKQFVITAYDEAGNLDIEEGSFEVTAVEKFFIPAHIDLGKIRAFNSRETLLGQSTGTHLLTVSLNKLQTAFTGPVKLYINDFEMIEGQNVSFTMVPSDILMRIEQIPPTTISINGTTQTNYNASDYLGDFLGELSITSEGNVKNANPIVSFAGRFDLYDVCKTRNIFVPYILNGNLYSQNMTCLGVDVGEYSNSSCTCQVGFPIDADTSKLSPIGTIESLEAERDGWRLNVSTNQARADISATWGTLYGFVLIVLLTVAGAYKFILSDYHKH